VDAAFIQLGRAYLPDLGKAYGAAWEDGAKLLEAGQPVSTAVGQVTTSWTTKRQALMDAQISPALAKVVPESTKDADVTSSERAALAAAWRGLARGLAGH
jgi:hypothetical protein